MSQGSSSGSGAVLSPAVATRLADLCDYAEGSVVSRTLCKGPSGTLTLFAFDAGQELSEHTAPFAAYLQILDGEAGVTIGGESLVVRTAEMVMMPAQVPHAVRAHVPFKMLLTMFREPARPAG